MKNRILRIVILMAVLLAACGQAKENDQGAVYVNITAEEKTIRKFIKG